MRTVCKLSRIKESARARYTGRYEASERGDNRTLRNLNELNKLRLSRRVLICRKAKIAGRKVEEKIEMKTTSQHRIAIVVLGAVAASTMGGMSVAYAGSKGRLNTTIAAGAITAYGLLKGNKTATIAGALGTAYAYSKYNSAKKEENRIEERNARRYQQRYGNSQRNNYSRR